MELPNTLLEKKLRTLKCKDCVLVGKTVQPGEVWCNLRNGHRNREAEACKKISTVKIKVK